MITRQDLRQLYDNKEKAKQEEREAYKVRHEGFDQELDHALKERFADQAEGRYRHSLRSFVDQERGHGCSCFDEIPF
jgi:hypothetical protein